MLYSRTKINTKGFTVLELIIVIVCFVVIIAIISASLSKNQLHYKLVGSADDIVATLVTARTKTLSSYGSSQYGVRVATGSVTLFTGAIYNGSATSNSLITLDNATTIASGSVSLNGGGSDVVFNRLTGATDNYGTITVQLSNDASSTKTVTITKSGLISSN